MWRVTLRTDVSFSEILIELNGTYWSEVWNLILIEVIEQLNEKKEKQRVSKQTKNSNMAKKKKTNSKKIKLANKKAHFFANTDYFFQ